MSIKYETIIDPTGVQLIVPNIASLIEARLGKPAPLKSNTHCAQSIGNSVLRQLDEERGATGGLRLSQSGTCVKQLAYQYHHSKQSGMQIGAASKIAFTIGDITESILVSALAEVFEDHPIGALSFAGKDQESVHMSLNITEGGVDREVRIAGHPDGTMLVMTSDNKPVECILEVKSMSDYGYRKFHSKGLGPDDSYYSQVQSYMHCKGLKWAYLVAYNKSAGARDAEIHDDGSWYPVTALHGQWIAYDEEFVEFNIKSKFKQVILSRSPEDFARPYTSNKKGQLAFPCDYCAYYKVCFPVCTEEAVESKWLTKSTKIKVLAGE